MKDLTPFEQSAAAPGIKADLIRFDSHLEILFALDRPERYWPHSLKAFSISGHEVPRRHELWKDTCFEVFLKQDGSSRYTELNFSLNPAWNCYHFQDYREPQPPQESSDFHLESLSWTGTQLSAHLRWQGPFVSWKVSMTAILKEPAGKTHYMAFHHASSRPDFHDFRSFLLNR